MAVRKWRSLILAYTGNKVVMVSGVHREYPERLYFPTDADKSVDADSVATACRILRTQTGINLLPSSLYLSRITTETSIPLHIYTSRIEPRWLTWFRPQTTGLFGSIKASLVEIDTILSERKKFGNHTRKVLYYSNLLKIMSPTPTQVIPAEPTSGVCQATQTCGRTFSTQSRGDSCPHCGSNAAY